MIHPIMPFKFPLSSASPPVYGYSEVHFFFWKGKNKIGEGIFHLFFSPISFLCVISKLLLQIGFSMQLSIFLLNQQQYTFSLSHPLEFLWKWSVCQFQVSPFSSLPNDFSVAPDAVEVLLQVVISFGISGTRLTCSFSYILKFFCLNGIWDILQSALLASADTVLLVISLKKKKKLILINLLIWLCRASVVAIGIFDIRCGIQELLLATCKLLVATWGI